MEKPSICQVCGDPITLFTEHEECMTEDASGCHESEYEHFEELYRKANNEVDEMRKK